LRGDQPWKGDIAISFLALGSHAPATQTCPHSLIDAMAQVLVRHLDDHIKAQLQQRARLHGWSMEEEVRQILRRAVNEPVPSTPGLGTRIAARFAGGGLDGPLPEWRGQPAEAMRIED
jgi:plasmid stability protein